MPCLVLLAPTSPVQVVSTAAFQEGLCGAQGARIASPFQESQTCAEGRGFSKDLSWPWKGKGCLVLEFCKESLDSEEGEGPRHGPVAVVQGWWGRLDISTS